MSNHSHNTKGIGLGTCANKPIPFVFGALRRACVVEPHIFDVWVPLKRSALPFAVSLPANSVCNLRLPQLTRLATPLQQSLLRSFHSLQVLSLRQQTRASVSSHSLFVCKSAIVLALNLTSCKQKECVAPSLCRGTKQHSCDGTTKRRANRYAFCFFKRRNH